MLDPLDSTQLDRPRGRRNPLRGSWRLPLPRGGEWVVGPRPSILGILNVTPDSFSDGGRFRGAEDAIAAALEMVRDGADAIDIGGESTRPGSQTIDTDEQIRRVVPVIRGLRQESSVTVSVDTRDPRVGDAALEAGADVINDVSACSDPDWIPVLRASGCPVILMHMRGTPRDMQEHTSYPRGVTREVFEFFEERMNALESAGIARSRMVLDPGIGFAKLPLQNLEILRELSRFEELGRPVLVGLSRKIFLGKILAGGDEALARQRDPRQRDIGSVAANLYAVLAGASVLRVHNVAFTRDMVDVLEALYGSAKQDQSAKKAEAT